VNIAFRAETSGDRPGTHRSTHENCDSRKEVDSKSARPGNERSEFYAFQLEHPRGFVRLVNAKGYFLSFGHDL